MQFANSNLGMTIDIRRMGIIDLRMDRWRRVFDAMQALESGAIANPDENRQVGHYWLRDLSIAPSTIGDQISASWAKLARLSAEIKEDGWKELLMIGIGGSALGPQLLIDALLPNDSSFRVHFIDNTDPDGMERVWSNIDLQNTVIAVISKSGGTKETRNAMLETRAYLSRQGIDFASRAIAITCEGSALYQLAKEQNWLGTLPLWSWVGGRTSVTGMVGLLPLALGGLDWRSFLRGASEMDEITRRREPENPALMLAVSWLSSYKGKYPKSMVVLPYKDRLMLFSRYLQQLVMESIGKRKNSDGMVVNQGLTVYGNKGSTDQHAFVQQLRDGPDDFFTTFLAVLNDRQNESIEVEPGITSGDYLIGFLIGTRNALSEAGRQSLTITLSDLDPYRMGALIALYERAVGFYASYIGINAYHQPGVEAGKKAAGVALELQKRILAGEKVAQSDDAWLIASHLRKNGRID